MPSNCHNAVRVLRCAEAIYILKQRLEDETLDFFLRGAREEYATSYLLHSLVGENNLPKSADRLTIESSRLKSKCGNNRQGKKIRNFHSAYKFLFGSQKRAFSSDLVCKLHRRLMSGLLRNAGCFRVKDAKPAGSIGIYYSTPACIRNEMKNLFINLENFWKDAGTFAARVAVAAWFYTQFLTIHPFSNGNGRLGRLLLSRLLLPDTGVPIFICKHYDVVHALESFRFESTYDPILEIIFDSCFASVSHMLFLLDAG